ncbi:S8 family peptidase [Azohydromonas lata]|uniref:S8 family peptidase n=1 Tax=Azohydromonas lata TaxID=45677 RepID=UPI003898F335
MLSKKSSFPLLALAAAAALTLQAAPAAAHQRPGVTPAAAAAAAAAADVTDRLIVKYSSAVDAAAPPAAAQNRANAVLQTHGRKLGYLRRTAGGAHVFKLDRAVSVAELRQIAQELRNGDADVEYAEPDLRMQPQFTPNDASYGAQWDFFEATAGLNLPTAWDKSTGDGVVVGVIDTGVRPHADLAANLLPGYDFIADATLVSNDGDGRDADPADPGDWTTAGLCYSGSAASNSSWHGTHVAGTIAAQTNNGVGVAGVAFNAKVLPVRALGRCGGYTSDIADAMVWAAGGAVYGAPVNPNPVRVLNLSLGGTGACPTTYQNAINTVRARGTVVVVAAGNANTDAINTAPANCAGVVTVAAVSRAGGKASYSNYGSVVDLAAPGGDSGAGILSTLNSGTTVPGADSYASYMGTSMATPHVAGVAALMLSRNPQLTPDDVETRLKASVRLFPATCSGCGTGLLDANAAVDAAGTPVAVTVTTLTEVEPNDTTGSAQSLGTLPVRVNGSIAKASDKDHYRVVIPAGGSVTATLTPNASSNYDLYLLSSTGTQLRASTLTGATADQLTYTNTGSTELTVVLQVRRASGLTGSGGTYSLAVSGN